MKKTIGVVVLATGALVALRASGGCMSKDPDQRLAGHFEAMCEIAEDGISHPARGVTRLGRYLGKHTSDMFGDFGATLELIEKIPNDAEHDDRARLARVRLHKPLHACQDTWIAFFDAVEADDEASEILERGLDRLGRTLEIIFEESAPIDVKRLPALLRKRL